MRIAFAIALLLTASACKTTSGGQSALNETEVRNFEDELGMKPGVGFDGILEDVRGVCTEFDALEKGGDSQEAVYQIKLVESQRDLMTQLDISSASQVKSAVPDDNIQASRKTKFAMGTTFSINKYSVYLLVSARIRNETTNLSNLRIKESVRQILAADPEQGLEAFRQQCGDSFLKAFSTGGEFQGLIEIKTDSDEMTSQLKNSYGQRFQPGAAVSGTGQSELQTGLAAITQNRDVRIWTYQRGGQGEEEVGLVSSVDGMMTRLKRLADSAKQGQNPRPLTATFADYFTLGLPLPAAYREKLQKAQDFIDDLAHVQQQLLDLTANLDFILQRPEGFVGVDAAKLREIRDTKTQIDLVTKKIRDKGRACSLSLNNCTVATDVAVPALRLPARKPTLASLTQENLKIKTTLHYLNREALSDGWFNPPECYLQVSIGGNGDHNSIPVRRTETTFTVPRCNNLQSQISVPMAIVKDTLKNLGVSLERGWVQIAAYEDDPSYDDLIGETWVYLRDLQNGAQVKGMNNSNVNLDVGFEIEY